MLTPLHGQCVASSFDESKAYFPDIRHRALRHHAEGIFLAERIFGPVITNSQGREIPTRFLGEQHVREDLKRIPTVQDWFRCLTLEPWMLVTGKLLYVAGDAEREAAKSESLQAELT